MKYIDLNGTIDKRLAVGVAVTQAFVSAVITFKALREQAAAANEIIEDQQQQVYILKEMVDYLVERADFDTVTELNSNLDYWRIVREIPVKVDEDGEN